MSSTTDYDVQNTMRVISIVPNGDPLIAEDL